MARIIRSLLTLACLAACVGSRCAPQSQPWVQDVGPRAMVITKEILSFGPRPPQSLAHAKVRGYLQTRLESLGLQVTLQPFLAQTPLGPINMVNLIGTIPASTSKARALVLLAHYDSKKFDHFEFVGANDAASSVALLIAMAEVLPKATLPFEIRIVLVDGEEALKSWSAEDSLYGSRHYVSQLPLNHGIQHAVVVDMISDKDLSLIRSAHSDASLVQAMSEELQVLGLQNLLDKKTTYVEDDHIPFVEKGIPVLHLMDFSYGGSETPGAHWHTYADTLENISQESLSRVGLLILRLIARWSDQSA